MAKWNKYQDINGFLVRPGVFRVNGAIQQEDGICFTINSHGATSCTLLLFIHRSQSRMRPFHFRKAAIWGIRIPWSYMICGKKNLNMHFSLTDHMNRKKERYSIKTISYWILMRRLSPVSVTGVRDRRAARICIQSQSRAE